MAERNKHLFQFTAHNIARAAREEANHHRERVKYWKKEMESSMVDVRDTAKVDIVRQDFTGGWRYAVVISYGDPAAFNRMNEACEKWQKHNALAERYESDAEVYGTQEDRIYELDTEDVHHFRLNGRPRTE